MDLRQEFFNKYLKKWIKKGYKDLDKKQKDLINEIPAYKLFVQGRENLIKAVKS